MFSAYSAKIEQHCALNWTTVCNWNGKGNGFLKPLNFSHRLCIMNLGSPHLICKILHLGIAIGHPPTVHWLQDNFVFGQNSKSLFVFRNCPVRSFGIFYATFEKQNGDFFILSAKKADLKNWKDGPKRSILGIFWCFWVTKSVLPSKFACKVVFFIIFADYDGWEPEKSRNNAQ